MAGKQADPIFSGINSMIACEMYRVKKVINKLEVWEHARWLCKLKVIVAVIR
jgi:hypothetical protein